MPRPRVKSTVSDWESVTHWNIYNAETNIKPINSKLRDKSFLNEITHQYGLRWDAIILLYVKDRYVGLIYRL